MTRVLLTYDAEAWAFHLECLALGFHFQRWAPGEFEPVLCLAGREPEDWEEFDIVYSSAWYDQRLTAHPRASSQLSSFTYWQNGWEHLGGRPKLTNWKHLATKNREIHGKLRQGDHPAPRLLYHQVNPKRWPYRDPLPHDGPFRVGFAGHRMESKGYDIIRRTVESMAEAEFIAVTFENNRRAPGEMPAFYHGLDAYVCASATEGGPRTGIEAGLCGAPIVTVKVGQLGEMVEDGHSGLMVERSTEAIYEALQRLQMSLELRQSLARNARQAFYQRVMHDGQRWVEWFQEVAA